MSTLQGTAGSCSRGEGWSELALSPQERRRGSEWWFLGDTAVRAGFSVSGSVVIVFMRNAGACSMGFEVSGD